LAAEERSAAPTKVLRPAAFGGPSIETQGAHVRVHQSFTVAWRIGDRLALPSSHESRSMETGSMKSPIRYSVLSAALLAAALGAKMEAAGSVGATSTPKTPQVESTYPSVLPLTLQVAGSRTHELGALRSLTITAQRDGDDVAMMVVGPVNPFTDDNLCKDPMPTGIIGCLVNGDATTGTLRVNWQVPQAGTYRFVLSARRGAGKVETLGAFELEARD
jgi:hypothetical protein